MSTRRAKKRGTQVFVSHSSSIDGSFKEGFYSTFIEVKECAGKTNERLQSEILRLLERREDELVGELARRGIGLPVGHLTEGRWAVGALSAFRWFCTRSARDDIDMVITDLRRDIKEMRNEGRGPWFIRFVVLWIAFSSVAAIVFGSIERAAVAWHRVRGKLSRS